MTYLNYLYYFLFDIPKSNTSWCNHSYIVSIVLPVTHRLSIGILWSRFCLHLQCIRSLKFWGFWNSNFIINILTKIHRNDINIWKWSIFIELFLCRWKKKKTYKMGRDVCVCVCVRAHVCLWWVLVPPPTISKPGIRLIRNLGYI